MKRARFYYQTRSTAFLWKSSLVAGLLVIGLGTGISFLNSQKHDAVERMVAESLFGRNHLQPGRAPATTDDVVRRINEAIRTVLAAKEPFADKLDDLRMLLFVSPTSRGLSFPAASEPSSLSDDQYRVAAAFFPAVCDLAAGVHAGPEEASAGGGVRELLELAAEPEPLPYANYALGLIYEESDPDAVEAAYRREAELFDRGAARERLIRFYLVNKHFDAIAELANDTAFQPFITPYVRQAVALARLDWPELVRNLVPAAYEHARPAMVVLALFSGLVWTVILLRFNGSLSVKSPPVRLVLPSLLLGALSAHATVLFIFWQEYQLKLGMPADVLGQFVYCLGIGLREEGLKLLFFLPLLPLLRRRSSLEILTVAGLVGLGFAMEENIGYFQRSAGLSALGRFVTANFLHISLTAMGGLALAQACIHRGEAVRQAVLTFVAIVAVHGLYDALMVVQPLADLAWLSFTVFVFLGYQYFGWLRHLRDDWSDPISITSVFTLGVVLLAGLTYTLHAWDVGAALAFRNVVGEVVGIGIILILFYREIPERLDG